MKILFIIPRLKNMFGEKGGIPGHPHVGVASLVAFLDKKNYEIKVFDEGIENNDQKLTELIKKFSPHLIGITTFSYCYFSVLELIERIRVITKTPIVLGGPHVSAVRKAVLEENKDINFAVKSEGEYTLKELLKYLDENRKDFSRIKGLIWRKNGKVVENPDRPLISNVDALPFPDYGFFDLSRYPCFENKLLPILTSRGCPYGCNYCSVRLSMGRGFRPRSPGNVLKEIQQWYQRGFNSFDINDDCFTLDLDRAAKICDLIIKSGLKIKFKLYNGIRVDRVSLSLLKKMKKAGCILVSYGCESGNQEVLNRIKKGIKLSQVVKAVTWANRAGIKNSVNFIIGHEGETYKQALETLAFAKSLPTDSVNFYNMVPYPGTDIYNWAAANARFLVPRGSFLKNISYRDKAPVFDTPEFTKKQREVVMSEGFALFEKNTMQLRFGNIFGWLLFAFTRVEVLGRTARWFVYSNKFGFRTYQFLSTRLGK